MGILDPKYKRLTPDVQFLSDEAVLVQAWKKCDTYIRRHNWYADILELEKASLMLPELIPKWCREIKDKEIRPEQDMRLVLAPKNGKWEFPDKQKKAEAWIYVPSDDDSDNDDGPRLRPLAHLGIREQTLAVASVLCLADIVESVQGNTEQESYKTAQKQGVYSYGNRLFCDWVERPNDKQHAHSRWGSATTYSQFFQDYQRFLRRSSEVCHDAVYRLNKERLYVVKLDLSKFYDCIDRYELIDEINEIFDEYIKVFDAPDINKEKFDEFCGFLKDIMDWQWSELDLQENKSLPKNGLPQGLVASGFFANAYMHRFDQKIGKLIGKKIKEDEYHFRLLDYCRYVDDMRIVVAVKNNLKLGRVEKIVSSIISKKLKKQFKSLTLNETKTEAIPWEDLAVQGSTSQFMRGVQKQISQAPDPITLANATGNLDHLLWLADTIDGDMNTASSPLELAHIAKPKVDVRDDTIQRFAANRLRTVLRLRRSMADSVSPNVEGSASSPVSEREALDHEIETIARKLVACFAKNPALTGVLRCGMDLFPSPDLLLPVLEALEAKLSNEETKFAKQERIVALYVLSDMLKAGAIETGFGKKESYPESSDIDGYRNELTRLAIELVSQDDLPWFVYQQALLFLAAMHYPAPYKKDDTLKSYNALHRALKFKKPLYRSFSDDFCAGLIVLQMTGKDSHFETWLCEWLNRLKAHTAAKMVDKIALFDPESLIAVCRKWKKNPQKKWFKHAQKKYLFPVKFIKKSKQITSWGDQPISLAAIVRHPENPFVQENALLKLAEALINKHDEIPFSESLSLYSLMVECKNWGSVQNSEEHIKVTYEESNKDLPWSKPPDWCLDGMEWVYHLGRLMRSAIIGKEDFTLRFYPDRDIQSIGYRRLKTSWYKRRVGLISVSDGLGEEVTPISPWMNELIMWLLQWPGLEVGGNKSIDFNRIKSQTDLLEIIKKRKAVLAGYYGKLSNLPVYLLPAYEEEKRDLSKFKVAIVQTLMPKIKDFCSHNPTYWKPEYRSKHRAHLASMCRLLVQQLLSNQIASKKGNEIQGRLDLIVFPELAVHPDDMWLLSRLSDQTKATIFAGQTFVNHSYLGKPINRAVWLLRQQNKSGRRLLQAFQGKQYVTDQEISSGVAGHRPFQIVVSFEDKEKRTANLSGVICYDCTDIKLTADLREVTDGLLIAAFNRDTTTFNTMVGALQYNMYQSVILANAGEFGGSTAQAPFKKDFERLISHVHGNDQALISLFEINLLAFKDHKNAKAPKKRKKAPAGYKGRK